MASASNVISVTCDCGKRLKAPASAAGKRARCPACGNVHVLPEPQDPVDRVPQPAARATAAAAPAKAPAMDPFESGASQAPAEDEDPFGVMYELANQENAAPAQNLAYCP